MIRVHRLGKLMWFSIVGTIGFVVDTAVLYLCVFGIGFGLYSGRMVSYLAAASTTWYLNRRLTFADADKTRPAREWLRFLLANAFGGLINYAVYAVLINISNLCTSYPVIGVAVGSLTGLAFNFTVSKKLVFISKQPSI